MSSYTLHEAAANILYAAADIDDTLSDHEIEKVGNILSYCSLFQDGDPRAVVTGFFQLRQTLTSYEVIAECAPYVSANFAPTLYAMLCDLLFSDGDRNEDDIDLLAVVAGKLGVDDYLNIAKVFMTRYAFNVKLA